MPDIAIAGATGFVGRALLDHLAAAPAPPSIVGLSRRVPDQPTPAYLQWRPCNLFNLLHTERALAGARTAIYLVHSMSPQAALAQGDFADMDLICADNFARAARRQGVEHIIYLGGLTPPDDDLSRHLESRLEVERALGGHGVPLTTLRAGLIIGAGGSSFDMMTRLVRRLPMMVAPRWARSRTQPVALRDVVRLLEYVIAHPEGAGRPYDVGCPDVMSYAEMLAETATLMQRSRHIVTVPIESPKLSLLWVSVVTGAPRQLVVPLVESLRHDMVVRDGNVLMQRAGVAPQGFADAMREALSRSRTPAPRRAVPKRSDRVRTVLSVQRLPLPAGRDARWVAAEYARWLPQFLWPLLRVDVFEARTYRFCLPFGRRPLLELTFAPHRSDDDRQLFYISGGLLARLPQAEPGRFEFRCALDREAVLSAVHDFVPSLPWYLYKATQAVAHQIVMFFFGRHLARAGRAAALRDAAD